MDAAAKEGFLARWLRETPLRKKAPGEFSTNPDSMLEGEKFDIFTPRASSVTSIVGAVMNKVHDNQTQRVIINLEFHSVSERKLIEQLEAEPLPGLKEVIIFNGDGFVYANLKRK